MRFSRRLRTLKLLPAIVAASLYSPAHAAWEVLPEAQISAENNDNLRLAPDNEPNVDSSSRTRLDARVTLSNFNERGNIYFEPRLRADAYADTIDKELDGTDTFLRGRGRYSWERVTLGFRSDYDRQDVRDAELTEAAPEDPDVEDPFDPDTGLVSIIEQDRERLILTPYAEFQVSERSSVLLEARLVEVSYTEAQLTGRANFEDREFAAGIIRRVDARNEVSARLIFEEYEAEFNQNKTETVGVEGNFIRPLGRGWTFNLAAGVSRSDYSFVNSEDQVIDNADTSFTYGLGFRQRTERNTMNFDLLRQTNPNSTGFLTLRDEIRIYVRRALTERLSGGLALRNYRTETLDDVVSNDQRDYTRVELDLEWALTPRLFLTGGVNLTSQEFQSAGREDATSNAVFVGFNYRGLSRQ